MQTVLTKDLAVSGNPTDSIVSNVQAVPNKAEIMELVRKEFTRKKLNSGNHKEGYTFTKRVKVFPGLCAAVKSKWNCTDVVLNNRLRPIYEDMLNECIDEMIDGCRKLITTHNFQTCDVRHVYLPSKDTFVERVIAKGENILGLNAQLLAFNAEIREMEIREKKLLANNGSINVEDRLKATRERMEKLRRGLILLKDEIDRQNKLTAEASKS